MNKTNANLILPLHLGWDEQETPVTMDLAELPHLLVAGTSDTGLERYLSGWIAGLLAAVPAEKLRLILFGGSEKHFYEFEGIEQLAAPLITDARQAFHCLQWLAEEAERRSVLLGCRQELPFHIVMVLNQFWHLMAVNSRLFEALIGRIYRAGGATKVHLILAADRPSVRVISGAIKAYMPARLSFALKYANDSRTVLDTTGAEVLEPGKMLFQTPVVSLSKPLENAIPQKLHANLWSKKDVQIVADSCHAKVPEYLIDLDSFAPEPIPNEPEIDTGDVCLDHALEIIRQTKRASTSGLQKRLRIGYTRAAALMDLLEERGFIGPPRDSGPREILFEVDKGAIPGHPPTRSIGKNWGKAD